MISKLSRRDLIIKGSTLSVASLGLLTGLNATVRADDSRTSQDIDVLNEILGTEHEGIAAYEICIQRKLLQKETLKTARLFQDQHRTHRDMLTEKISTLGGTPVKAKPDNEYADDLDTAKLQSQKEALSLIVNLELGAANAYIGMLPSTNDHELVKVASRIAADEVIHWATLASILHLPLPNHALFFGA